MERVTELPPVGLIKYSSFFFLFCTYTHQGLKDAADFRETEQQEKTVTFPFCEVWESANVGLRL